MVYQQRQIERALVLPEDTWHEIDERAQALGTRADVVIREALHTYFDLVGAPTGRISVVGPSAQQRLYSQ